MRLPDYIQNILDTFQKAGYQAYVVGGCVRDALLGKEPHDYDICTNALPKETQKLFAHCIPTGLKHGTVTIIDQSPVEVTTFRKEEAYTDHRHPDKVSFVSDIESDLSRRDFTINAMAYHPSTGIIDLFGGQEDLRNHIIRCVNDPTVRFDEDALRMVRAFRFAAKLHFTIEEKTMEAIVSCAPLMKYVSVERVTSELVQILRDDPFQLEHMTDVLEPWIPELKESQGCLQRTSWHDSDVLHHILRAVDALEPFDETVAYTLLFHDLGKPSCRTSEGNIDHFYGHQSKGREIAYRLCKDLKLTKEQSRIIPELVAYHDLRWKDPYRIIRFLRIENGWNDAMVRMWMEVKRCDLMAHSQKGQNQISEVWAFQKAYQEALAHRPMTLKQLPINGKDIMDAFGLQGKQVGQYLHMALLYAFDHPDADLLQYISRRISYDHNNEGGHLSTGF